MVRVRRDKVEIRLNQMGTGVTRHVTLTVPEARALMLELARKLPGNVYVTTSQAARMSGLSGSTVLRAVKKKRMRSYATPGGHYRVLAADAAAAAGKR